MSASILEDIDGTRYSAGNPNLSTFAGLEKPFIQRNVPTSTILQERMEQLKLSKSRPVEESQGSINVPTDIQPTQETLRIPTLNLAKNKVVPFQRPAQAVTDTSNQKSVPEKVAAIEKQPEAVPQTSDTTTIEIAKNNIARFARALSQTYKTIVGDADFTVMPKSQGSMHEAQKRLTLAKTETSDNK